MQLSRQLMGNIRCKNNNSNGVLLPCITLECLFRQPAALMTDVYTSRAQFTFSLGLVGGWRGAPQAQTSPGGDVVRQYPIEARSRSHGPRSSQFRDSVKRN